MITSSNALSVTIKRAHRRTVLLSFEAIESHRLKYKVIDSWLDAEGFTPLHRAAKGPI